MEKKIINFLRKQQVGETIRDLGLDGQSEKAGIAKAVSDFRCLRGQRLGSVTSERGTWGEHGSGLPREASRRGPDEEGNRKTPS